METWRAVKIAKQWPETYSSGFKTKTRLTELESVIHVRKVFNGWLITAGYPDGRCLTFMPDSNHEQQWDYLDNHLPVK